MFVFRYTSSVILCAAMPTENPKCFMVWDIIACVYISTFEANLGSKLNSLNFDSSILFLPLGIEFRWNETLDSVPEQEQNIPRFLLGVRGQRVKLYFSLRKAVSLYYIKFLTSICKQKIALAFIIVTIH